MVSKIRFKNFKLFKNWQELEIKPITILIGKNNSGKTALLKLPFIVNSIIEEKKVNTVYKINKNFPDTIELGTDFIDLVYNRRALGILEFEIKNQTQKKIINVALSKDGLLNFKLKLNGEEINLEANSKLEELKSDLETFKFNIDYIGGIRIEPQNNYSFKGIKNEIIGLNGTYTYDILINDLKNNEKSLIRKIDKWYQENFEGWNFDVFENKESTETNYSIVISNNKIDYINIKQTGQGIYQVLPLITRSFLSEGFPNTIIIEEPETHLHPAAHGNLAERFVNSYKEDPNKRYLIETHSQNFVLRLRRLVAEKKLKPEDLAIYYVDFKEEEYVSELKKIEVDELGKVNFWPDGIFSETLEETMALRDAQFKK
jgi:predicted ATPase